MAEAHPVAFQWVMEAKARGATVVHVDPHYCRTSALADIFVPLRAGSDIAFLGGVINHVLSHRSDFREYVLAYTNAPTIVGEEFEDAGADGLSPATTRRSGDTTPKSWQYEGALSPQRRVSATRKATFPRQAAAAAARMGDRARRADARPDARAPRCVWQILKRHYAALHAGDGRARLRRAAGAVRAGLRALCRELGPRAHDGVRARGRLDAAHDRLAVHPGGLDPATAARQHGPARRRRDGDARARLDPGLERHPDAVRHASRATSRCRMPTARGPRRLPRRGRARGASGATCATTRSAC